MKARILLIEDDVVVRENTAEILRFSDYEVLTAPNGKRGVILAKKEFPDIIICDIMMPKLDGYGVLQVLSNDEKLKDIPFIFLSAKANHEDIRKGMNLGADDFLTKPFEESELLTAIATRLQKAKIYKNKPSQDLISISYEQLNGSGNSMYSFVKMFRENKSQLFKKGENIYCEGNSSKYIFLIKEGSVKTYKTTKEGKELITGIHKDSKFLGLISCIGKFSYTDNAEALEDSLIIKIKKSIVFSLLQSKPSFAQDLIQLFANNIKSSKEKMLQIAYDSVRGRTAKSILLLATHAPQNKIHISRNNLANITGIAKETLIRTLTDFKDEGLIETGRAYVRLVDKEGLMKVN